ncbi:hypothetical protein B5S28_g5280 [[Candida] boidinii]|uniref:Unnamed protein product n=1 Tax=Candida boidinii TaxID=5477 RepID=A0ACB5TSM9_CANBO|nr:hypothetical protein B5S28_g5280 [[Candida] boidinii]OWB64000.1 hypothetical protein B5S29_g5027 [[Candida] boidinii]GME94040.1 unnamed protein product [[Candida] boidinii]
MITALFIFNQKGDLLISKLFKEGAKRNISEVFRIQVIANKDSKSPVLTFGSTTFIHIKIGYLWFVAVTRSNIDASIVLEFLFNFINLLKTALLNNKSSNSSLSGSNSITGSGSSSGSGLLGLETGGGNSNNGSGKKSFINGSNSKNQLNEDVIRNNFSIIYEILDEILEFGYPQTTDWNYIKPSIDGSITIINNSKDFTGLFKNENNGSGSGSGNGGNGSNINDSNGNSTSGSGSGLFSGLSRRTSIRNTDKENTNGSVGLLQRGKSILRSNKSTTNNKNQSNNVSNNNNNNNNISEVSWRQQGIKYRKNEVYIDIIEELNVLIGSNGNIIRSFVDGKINMNSKLSGMPICSFGFSHSSKDEINQQHSLKINKKRSLRDIKNSDNPFKNNKNSYDFESDDDDEEDDDDDDEEEQEEEEDDYEDDYDEEDDEDEAYDTFDTGINRKRRNTNTSSTLKNLKNKNLKNKITDFSFHQCVNLQEFDKHNLIKFIPPDGKFELMRYKIDITEIPFNFFARVQIINNFTVRFKITIQPNFNQEYISKDILIKIPTPPGTIKVNFNSVKEGKTKYLSDESCINWNIKKIIGESSPILIDCDCIIAQNNDNSNLINWTKKPINLSFKIDEFSISHQFVKFLKIKEISNYTTVKWVRYSTNSKSYEIRY